MLPACNKGAGMNMGFPDVCLTPAGPAVVPIPYPNMAMHATAAPFAPNVLLSMMPALNLGSIIPMTLGDQPGVANPLYMQMGQFTMGDPAVMINGLPGVTLTSPTSGNMMNNAVGMVQVPSVTNVFFSLAAGATALDGDSVRDIVDTMSAGAGPAVEVADLPGGALHLRVRAFASDVASQIYAALHGRAGLAALVIDLRGNRGGELSAFLALAADFLPRGSELVTVIDADGDALVHRVRHDPPYAMPVTVLVDHATASAAELFAGCLQAHGRALIVGEPTTGKATSNLLLPHEGGATYVAVGRCLLPGGADIQGRGVSPDVLIAPGDDALRYAARA
jgi:carboxyl-terminal processing protease